jgi:uncharacterized protein
MSQENVELVRRGYEAFNRGDLEGMAEDFAPDLDYVTTGLVPGSEGAYRGREAWIEYTGWSRGEFENPRAVVHELIDAGDRVVAAVTMRGRGKRSGIQAGWDVWQVWTIRGGKAVSGRGFTSRKGALEAAGLSE